jgi:hypothetical protein
MRTLTAHEAIDVAERLNIVMFDRYLNSEVTVEQAKLLIQRQRDPVSFVLEDWPETDREAEQIVLRRFHAAMIAKKMMEFRISDTWHIDGEGRGIHRYAAEMAARRLVEQNELELVQRNQEETLYRIPRNVHFTEEFLDGLRVRVCDECAHLNPSKSFHKTCLLALLDHLINGEFTLDAITVVMETPGPGTKLPNLLRYGVSARWLSQTVSATKWRLKSVVKPILFHESTDDSTVSAGVVSNDEWPFIEVRPPEPELGVAVDAGAILTRDKISKTELIRYLRSVEIVDEDGELAALKSERDDLRRQLEAKEREIHQIGRQRMLLQGQCEDMQRDMDTLLQAMQIAKRRGHVETHVIDAEIERK